MHLRTRLSLLLLLLLGLGISLPLAQIRFDKPPSGTSYSPLSFQGTSSSLFSLKNGTGGEWFNLDSQDPLGHLRVGQHTLTHTTDVSGILEKGVLQSNPTWSPPSNSGTTVSAVGGTVTTGGSSNIGRLFGGAFNSSHAGSGTITNLIGSRVVSSITSTGGPATNMMGLYIVLQNSHVSSTAGEVSAIQIDLNKFTTGPMTNAKGLFIRSGYGGVTGNKHGVYVEDTAAMNYFGHNVGVKVTSPAHRLDVSLGTITSQAAILNSIGTWNAGGVTFTALKTNITDTASASASLLLDLQVGSASKFAVRKDGQLTLSGGVLFGTDNSVDIGAAGATRPRDLHLGRNLIQAAGGYYELLEIAEPSAPGSNGTRLYSKDDGAGKTQLCARFASGASQCFAVEP